MDVLNSTVPEPQRLYPLIEDYYTDIEIFTILTIAAGGLFFLINNLIFLLTLCKIFKNVQSIYRWHTLAMCILYPIVAWMAALTLLLPHIALICHNIMHISFTICAYVFYHLLMKYVGGELKFVRNSDADIFNIRTPPCCCCCLFLKPMSATIERISFVRYMLLQLPIVQTAIALTIIIVFYADYTIFNNATLYLTPFMVFSILIGLWGLNILVRLIQSQANNHNIMLKYICIQLVLVFCKLQPAILDGVFNFIQFPSGYPLTLSVYKQNIIQVIILAEMIPLSILAQKAYQKPKSVI